MPTLRGMIDGTEIFAGAPVASKPSPVAKHVASHIQDPLGSTKQDFGKLQTAKLNYDQAREEAQRNLAPVQSVIDMASQLHGLTVGNNQTQMPGTPAMGQSGPGMPQDNPDVDENGNPIPGQSGSMVGKPAAGNGQNPQNMSQTVGKMNMKRPSQAGFQPGVAPSPQETVRPPKLGQAQPGKPTARNSPSPPGSNNPQGEQYNKQASPPKGNRSLPGAKGPGDPKVENRTKKAQNKSAREIKVHVTASAIPNDICAGASNRLETQMGRDMLCMPMMQSMPTNPGKPTTISRTPVQGNPGHGVGGPVPRVQGGPSSLSDKDMDPQHDVAYNPVMRSKGKKVKLIRTCKNCGLAHVGACSMKARGHSLGAKKGWAARGKGHLAKPEKDALYKAMDAGGPGSGRHATLDTLRPDQQKIANGLHKAGLASELRDYFSNVVPGGFNGERLYDHMNKKFGVGKWNGKEGADHIMKITSTPGGLKRFRSFKGY